MKKKIGKKFEKKLKLEKIGKKIWKISKKKNQKKLKKKKKNVYFCQTRSHTCRIGMLRVTEFQH